MRIVISWFSDNCIFQTVYSQEQLPFAKKLFYDQLSRMYDIAWVEALWSNVEFEFTPERIAEYGPNHSHSERILSTFMITFLT